MAKNLDKYVKNTLINVYNTLRQIEIAEEGNGWVYLAEFGIELRKQKFNYKDYDYSSEKLVDFIKNTKIFDLYIDKSKKTPVVYLRKHPYSELTNNKANIRPKQTVSNGTSIINNPMLEEKLKDYYKALSEDAEIRDPEVVGFYETNKDGNYQFSDIRDTLFHEHKYPATNNNEARDIIVSLDGPINALKLNRYYIFSWIVSLANNARGYVLDIDKTKNVRSIDPENLINSLHELWDDRSHGTAMNAAMETISSELMASSDGTFIYELLQNANDYPRKDENGNAIPVEVEFHMTDKCLICRHSGSAFSPRDVASICSIGNGSKTKNKNAIGYKGIGFKTVFHAHDWVYVKSGDYSFRFDKSHEKEGRPFQIMPIWTPDLDLSAINSAASTIVHDGERDFSVQTVMMPRKLDYLYGMDKNQESEKSHEFVLRDMFKDIRDIVFIPNIKSVKVYFPNEEPIVCSKGESQDWVISMPYVHKLDPDTEKQEIIDECDQHPERRIPPKYKSFEDTYVSFAAKKDGNVILPVKDATVNCYLPTKAEFGFPFLMNTDMVPSGDRNQLKLDVKFNQLFARIAGNEFVSWIKQLLTDGYEPESVFNLIPDFNSVKDGVGKQYKVFIECFEEGFKNALTTIPIIPVEGADELQLPIKVLRDVTEFSAKKIICPEKFLEYSGHKDLYLPLASICSNSRLIKILNESGSTKFNDPNLVALFENTSFRNDLLNLDINAKVVEFILNYPYRDNYKDISLFIDHVNGRLSKSSSLFLNIDDDLKYLSSYENQLEFLSVKTREILKSDSSEQNDYIEKLMNFKWADYDAYASVIKPLFETSSHKSDNLALLENSQTNYDMFKFIGKHQIKEEIVKTFPILLSDGQYGTLTDICFFYSDGAVELSGNRWVDKSWYSILSKNYDDLDMSTENAVKKIFKCYGVQEFSNKAFYERVIKNNNAHIEQINKISSSDFSICSKLLTFLFSIWNEKEIGSFNHFLLPVVGKNGLTSYIAGKNATIFLYDQSVNNSLSALINKNWIAEGWAYVLDHRCQRLLDSIGSNNVNKILKEKFSIKDATVEGFCQNVVVKNITDIVKDITPVYLTEAESQDIIDKRKETRSRNLDFFKFVCDNYSSIFSNGSNPFYDVGYPFCLCNNERYPNSPGKYYNYSPQALEAASQDWLPADIMGVIDNGYAEITSTFNRAKELYTSLRVSDFSYSSFLKEDVCSNKRVITRSLDAVDKSVSFHAYFKANRNSFSPEDIEKIKNFPVYIVSGESSQMVMTSTGHHIINEQVSKLTQAGYGTAGTMDMILPDYFDDKKADAEYWINILGNKEFSFTEIATWMTNKSQEVIAQKTNEKDGNIAFWRIVKKLPGASNKDNQKALKSLRIFPVYARLVKEDNPAIKVLDATMQCYVSDSYFAGGGGVEYMLKEYADSSFIIASDYLEDSLEETVESWKKFWESAGFLSSNEELVINTIIPNLDKPENQNEKVALLLFQNKATIDKNLSDSTDVEKVDRLKADLNKLYIKTKGGLRQISEVFFVQKNDYAPFDEPMAYMPLLTQAFEYPDEQYSFFMSIGERAGSRIIKDQTVWRLEKIKQFAALQCTSESEDRKLPFDFESIHFPFVRDLSEWFSEMNSLDYGTYYRNIKLYDRTGNLCPVKTLTEGSVYSPYCDFESCGLTGGLNYISDEYAEIKNIRPLLKDMGIHYFFWKEDIPLLENKKFALYFWNKYMADSEARDKVESFINEGAFANIKCVPTVNGVKTAETLYNTFGTYDKEDLSSYVNLLKDGKELCAEGIIESFIDRFDENRRYPNPIGKLDFLCVLSKEHCFEYLMNSKVENTAKRRYVLAQLLKYQHEGKLPDHDIESYRSSEYAMWMTGQKEPAHISTLYAIGRQAEDKYFLRHFGNSPLVINNDTISDTDTAFEEICTTILKIKILHGGDNSDFVTKPSADSHSETEQIRLALNQKSLLLATIINAPEGEDWKVAYDRYVAEIATLNFVKCGSISIEFKDNADISKSDVDAFFYDKSTRTFYYLKDWQHKFVFDSMLKMLIKVLEIPGEDEMTIKKILDKDLESLDVDYLVKEYCTNFYEDDRFRELLSRLYPETSGRLNIRPSTSEDEDQPRKLVAFSETREKEEVEVSNTILENQNVSEGGLTAKSHYLENDYEVIQGEQRGQEEISVNDSNATCTHLESSTPGAAVMHQVISENKCEDKPVVNEILEEQDEDGQNELVGECQTEPATQKREPSQTITSHIKSPASTITVKPKTAPESAADYENTELENEENVDAQEYNFFEYIFDPDEGEPMGSIEKDRSYQQLGEKPHKPRKSRRYAKPYTKEELNRLRSKGTPLELESLRATTEELDVLAQCGISPEQIADTNYLAQLRLYRNLQKDLNEEPEESLAEFVRNADDVSEHKMKSGKFIHACSAARGVMYVSPSVWNKMMDDTWVICVYLDGQGKNFHYINTKEEFLKLVQKDDVVIKITGNEKVNVVNDLYSGLLKDVKGTAYTLVRVAARTNMDAVFAHYVGAMAEANDGNENLDEY